MVQSANPVGIQCTTGVAGAQLISGKEEVQEAVHPGIYKLLCMQVRAT